MIQINRFSFADYWLRTSVRVSLLPKINLTWHQWKRLNTEKFSLSVINSMEGLMNLIKCHFFLGCLWLFVAIHQDVDILEFSIELLDLQVTPVSRNTSVVVSVRTQDLQCCHGGDECRGSSHKIKMKKHSTKFLPVVVLNTNGRLQDISGAHSSILETQDSRDDVGGSYSLFGWEW